MPPSSSLPLPHFPAYTDAALAAVCRELEEGLPLPEAFLCHGIPSATGLSWLAARPDFAHATEVARARYVRSLIRAVREAVAGSGARHDWRASLALLERADEATAAAEPVKTPGSFARFFTPAQAADLRARVGPMKN